MKQLAYTGLDYMLLGKAIAIQYTRQATRAEAPMLKDQYDFAAAELLRAEGPLAKEDDDMEYRNSVYKVKELFRDAYNTAQTSED